MKVINLVINVLLITLVIASCTIEKRLHTKGYSVRWHNVEKQKEQATNKAIEVYPNQVEEAHPDIVDNNNENKDEAPTSSYIKHASKSKTTKVDDDAYAEKVSSSIPDNKTNQFNIDRSSPKSDLKSQFNTELVDDEPKSGDKNGFAITSLVLGLLGISVLALIFGMIQLKLIRTSPNIYSGRGMATAGIVLGYFGLAFICIFLLPINIGVIALIVLSLLFFVYGITLVHVKEEDESLGIAAIIFGWLGVLAATFFATEL